MLYVSQVVLHTCGILQGRTALHYAAAANCTQAIQLLVARGADVNAKDSKVRLCWLLRKRFMPWLIRCRNPGTHVTGFT